MWVDRWLAPSDDEPTRTAYLELVATDPRTRGQGLATAAPERLQAEVRRRLRRVGAEPGHLPELPAAGMAAPWQGPLSTRLTDGTRRETPDEEVLDLAGTWAGGFGEPLSIEWREGEVWRRGRPGPGFGPLPLQRVVLVDGAVRSFRAVLDAPALHQEHHVLREVGGQVPDALEVL